MYLNIVFHRVVVKDKDIEDLYEITIDQFVNSLDLIRKLTTGKTFFLILIDSILMMVMIVSLISVYPTF